MKVRVSLILEYLLGWFWMTEVEVFREFRVLVTVLLVSTRTRTYAVWLVLQTILSLFPMGILFVKKIMRFFA